MPEIAASVLSAVVSIALDLGVESTVASSPPENGMGEIVRIGTSIFMSRYCAGLKMGRVVDRRRRHVAGDFGADGVRRGNRELDRAVAVDVPVKLIPVTLPSSTVAVKVRPPAVVTAGGVVE